jgi:hypothetical protein
MVANALYAKAPAMFDRLAHYVESRDLIAEKLPGPQVATGADPSFHQGSRRRHIMVEQTGYQLALGDVPPIALLHMD